jgi:CRP-like cAMP-binding protein
MNPPRPALALRAAQTAPLEKAIVSKKVTHPLTRASYISHKKISESLHHPRFSLHSSGRADNRLLSTKMVNKERSSPPLLLLEHQKDITSTSKNTSENETTKRQTRRASWAPSLVIPSSSGSNSESAASDPECSDPGACISQGHSPAIHSSSHSSLENAPSCGPQTRQLKAVKLPRGGTYVTTCVGPIQIGIPPESIKDCLNAGLAVPRHYIVPLQRFNRRLGGSLGINVCEFEFPAYYSFFFQRQSLNLIVDSMDVEAKIRAVFQETLFGPIDVDPNVDFAPDYPMEKRPDLLKESQYFRKFGDTFLEMDMLLSFTHFDDNNVAFLESSTVDGAKTGVRITRSFLRGGEYHIEEVLPCPGASNTSTSTHSSKCAPHNGHNEGNKQNSQSTEHLPGTATFSGIVQLRDRALRRSTSLSSCSSMGSLTGSLGAQSFVPPPFGVTVLGSSHGFDCKGCTSGYVLWIGRRGIMIDPPPYSSSLLEKQQIHPSIIDGVILTHCHADHDAGTFQKLLCEKRITLYTTATIYESFIRKYSALSGIDADFLMSTHHFRPVKIGGQGVRLRGASFRFFYSLHSIPCIGLEVFFADKSIVFSADHCNDPSRIRQMHEEGILSAGRRDELLNFPWNHDLILHEAGVPPIHTPLATLEALDDDIKKRMYLVHVSEGAVPKESKLKIAPVGVKNTLEVPVDVPEFSEAISVLGLIGDIHLLTDLTLTQARGLLEIGYKRRFAAGEVVVGKGSIPTDFCVLSSGLLEVTYPVEEEGRPEDEEAANVRRVHWSVGDYFGEVAFLQQAAAPVQEEVRALTDVEIVVFAGSELRYLLAHAPISSRMQLQARFSAMSPSTLSYTRLERLLTFNYTLNSLTRAQKLALESLGETTVVAAGKYVWRAGSEAAFSVMVDTGSLTYQGCCGQLMKSLGSQLYRCKGSISSSSSLVVANVTLESASEGIRHAGATLPPNPLPDADTGDGISSDDLLTRGEDATQSPCPPEFTKGNFVGAVDHSAFLPGKINCQKRRAHDLVALTDAVLLVFHADKMTRFFQENPGVLLCLLDAEFVL